MLADAVRLAAVYAAKPQVTYGDDISALIKLYRAAPDGFQKLAPSTQSRWGSALKYIDLEIGTMKLVHLKAKNARSVLKAWRNKRASTPRTADYYMQVLSAIFAFGREEGVISDNPILGVSKLYSVDRSDVIVEEHELERILDNVSVDAAYAIRFAAASGIRRGDLVSLKWDSVKARSIEFRTRKSGGRTPMVIPLRGDTLAVVRKLREKRDAKIASGEVPSAFVFTSSLNKPWKEDSITNAFLKGAKAGGVVGKDLHDLRGTAATRYSQQGVSHADIAYFIGWDEKRVDRIISRYVSKGSMAEGALDRLESHAKTA